MLRAGYRKHRVRIDRRAAATDAYGNAEGAWEAVTTVWAAIDTRQKAQRETVEAGRLESRQVWRVTVISSALVAGVGSPDRMVVVAGPHSGAVLNVRGATATEDGRERVFEVEQGGAV